MRKVLIDKGLALIFNWTFNRPGSQRDVNNLKVILKKICFDVDICSLESENHEENYQLIDKKMAELNEEIWQAKFKKVDCLMVINMSHASADDRLSGERDLFDTYLMPLLKLSELDGKLKILISNSCRGNNTPHHIPQTDGLCPMWMFWFSASHGLKSGRRESSGSPFVLAICTAFEKGGQRNDDLVKIIENLRIHNSEQRPELEIFFPKDEIKFMIKKIH